MFSRKFFIRFIATGAALAAWLIFVFITAFYGWWMKPVVSPGDSEAFFRQAVELLQTENASGNSAFILIEEGAIAAEYYSNTRDPINADTVFSTASMSKWIAAAGVMKLAEDGHLDLDAPVSNYLKRWQLPPSEYDNGEVTIRRLLSHTAGLTDGLGFGDYTADEALPTLVQSLTSPRASSGDDIEIVVNTMPGTEWQYSGGSFLILELLVEEVSGVTFEEYMEREIFLPLGMDRTTYAYLGEVDNNAGSITGSGENAPIYQYASSAATAFATSASDLSKFVRAQIPTSNIDALLSHETVDRMREPHGRSAGADIWGLGTMLYSPTPQGDFVFGHDGGNEPAINSTARINPSTADGIIILETGNPSLATRIGSQWVLWQTGYPDILDLSSVFSSMLLPAAVGSLFLILAAALLLFRRTKTQSRH